MHGAKNNRVWQHPQYGFSPVNELAATRRSPAPRGGRAPRSPATGATRSLGVLALAARASPQPDPVAKRSVENDRDAVRQRQHDGHHTAVWRRTAGRIPQFDAVPPIEEPAHQARLFDAKMASAADANSSDSTNALRRPPVSSPAAVRRNHAGPAARPRRRRRHVMESTPTSCVTSAATPCMPARFGYSTNSVWPRILPGCRTARSIR